MRTVALLLGVLTWAGWPGAICLAQSAARPPDTTAIASIVLENFAFRPSHIHLRAGVPVRLVLTNQSSGAHDFSAPEFFATASFVQPSAAPPEGRIEVKGQRIVQITLVPRVAGSYRLSCTHFLHSLFGMHGTIDVTP